MLKYFFPRFIRNQYYKFSKIFTDPNYFSFFRLVNKYPDIWKMVHKYPGKKKALLLTCFQHKSLQSYSGNELAIFNGKHVACYWMPKQDGEYDFMIYDLFSQTPVYIRVEKFHSKLFIKYLSHSKENKQKKYTKLYGNLLNYKNLIPELQILLESPINQIKENI